MIPRGLFEMESKRGKQIKAVGRQVRSPPWFCQCVHSGHTVVAPGTNYTCVSTRVCTPVVCVNVCVPERQTETQTETQVGMESISWCCQALALWLEGHTV